MRPPLGAPVVFGFGGLGIRWTWYSDIKGNAHIFFCSFSFCFPKDFILAQIGSFLPMDNIAKLESKLEIRRLFAWKVEELLLV